MKAAESVDGEEKRETSRTSLGGLVEFSREVLTRLSALAWVEQRRRYTYVTGGLTTPKHWHLLLGHLLRGYRLKIEARVQYSRWRCPCLHQLAVLNAG